VGNSTPLTIRGFVAALYSYGSCTDFVYEVIFPHLLPGVLVLYIWFLSLILHSVMMQIRSSLEKLNADCHSKQACSSS